MSYDVAIIGAGPGGCSAAITAARAGKSVLLLESSSFPRQKVCGEFVSGESVALLTALLGTAAFAEAPLIERARIFAGWQPVELRIGEPARSITRWQMDQALWSAARSNGVECRDRTSALSVSRETDEFLIATSAGEFRARAVIQAAGRWSRFSQYEVPQGPKWLGVKAHFHEAKPAASCDLYFFAGGYCGVQPISGDAVNVCAMVRSDRAVTLHDVFSLHPELATRASGWEQMTETVTTSPLVFRTPTPTRDSMLLVGDAAAFVDPFVGDGISIALHTGRMAAEAVAENSLAHALLRYSREYNARVVPALNMARRARRTLEMPQPLRGWALRLFARTGLGEYVVSRTRVRAA